MATLYGDYEYKWNPEKRKHTYVHRDLMEAYLGRELSSDEVVHHKDGNKKNNEINNLEVLPLSFHVSKHLKGISRMGPCIICEERHHAKGLCKKHYRIKYPERHYSKNERKRKHNAM